VIFLIYEILILGKVFTALVDWTKENKTGMSFHNYMRMIEKQMIKQMVGILLSHVTIDLKKRTECNYLHL
jgi:hypothetical protein